MGDVQMRFLRSFVCLTWLLLLLPLSLGPSWLKVQVESQKEGSFPMSWDWEPEFCGRARGLGAL